MPNTVVKMPQLGESVAEGTVGRWLKQPGERVERDEPLVEIQTDKVNAEVPSPVAGILQEILLPEGSTAAVKTDIAVIGDEVLPGPQSEPPRAEPTPAHEAPPRPEPPPPSASDEGKRFYTPVVLRMAQKHGLDLSTIQGTGTNGRVTRRDVERALGGAPPAAEPAKPAAAPGAPP